MHQGIANMGPVARCHFAVSCLSLLCVTGTVTVHVVASTATCTLHNYTALQSDSMFVKNACLKHDIIAKSAQGPTSGTTVILCEL